MESFDSYENFNDWYEALIKVGEAADKSFSYKLMFLNFMTGHDAGRNADSPYRKRHCDGIRNNHA